MKLFYRSIELDIRFMLLDLPLREKAYFIFAKYLLLFRNYLVGFKKGQASVKVFGENYFYEDKFGIAFLQSVYNDSSFLKKYIKPRSIIIDVGANIGQFNFFCKKYLEANRVYSFEPIVQTFKILKKNTNNLNVYNYAVSTVGKRLKMYLPETSLMATSIKSDYRESVLVEPIHLKDIREIETEKKIDLLKIDTEGSEYDVVLASKKIIKKTKYLLIEVSLNRDGSKNFSELFELLLKIAPTVKVVDIGRVYRFGDSPDCVDVLFKVN